MNDGLLHVLVIPNYMYIHHTVNTDILVHSHVDHTISWHGEPHVVRVGVDRKLVPSIHVEVFFIIPGPILCEDLDILIYIIIILRNLTTEKGCIH